MRTFVMFGAHGAPCPGPIDYDRRRVDPVHTSSDRFISSGNQMRSVVPWSTPARLSSRELPAMVRV